ncbi:MAG TPA: peptidylprolyl isomerase [Polyangiaceae bacterium]|nr:peptidylprolyl isomerase [Polyangiaceae bacterium]
MQRWSSVVLGLVFAVGMVVLAVSARPKSAAQKAAPSAVPEPVEPPAADVPTETHPIPAPELEPAPAEDAEEPSATKLPPGAPKAVRFGVILVTYRGAQFAKGDARSKKEAQELAAQLAGEAQEDFEKAVKKGDKGSVLNAGRIPRGVLEPSIEQVLFTLEKGKVHDQPLDTPRGFWIVKRTE